MPAYGTETDLPELIEAVRVKVRDVTGLTDQHCFFTLTTDDELMRTPPASRTFVTLRLGRFAGRGQDAAGGGLAAYDGILRVQLWHKLETDSWRHAGEWLRSEGGVLNQWLKILGGLQLFTPLRTSDTTKALVIEPMRNNPGFDFPERRPPGWGRLDSAWEMKFVHRLS